jgi:hypothetical protein
MKTVLMIVGVLLIAAGLMWAGQGAGYIHWPQPQPGQFTMVDNSKWIYYGGATALAGLLLFIWSRR